MQLANISMKITSFSVNYTRKRFEVWILLCELGQEVMAMNCKADRTSRITTEYAQVNIKLDNISSQPKWIQLDQVAGDRWTLHSVARYFDLISWYFITVTVKALVEVALQELHHRSRKMFLILNNDLAIFREIADQEG